MSTSTSLKICENIQKRGWEKVWIEDQQAPYATADDQWVGFDDEESLRIKVETLVNGYGLAGAFVWSIDLDDLNGVCGYGKFPLLTSINKALNNQSSEPITRPDYEYPSSYCDQLGTGTQPDESSCHNFFQCVRGFLGWIKYFHECPPGLSYSSDFKACVYKFDCL